MDEIVAADTKRLRKYEELEQLLTPSLGLTGDCLTEEVDIIRANFEKTGEISPRIPPELRHRACRLMLEALALWRVHLELMNEYDKLCARKRRSRA